MRKVVENEIKAREGNRILWLYRSRKEKPGSKEIRVVVRTRQGTLDTIVSRNNRPLTAEQRQKEEAKIQELVANSEEQTKRQQEQRGDGERAKGLLQMLPDASLFSYDGRNRGLVRLKFKPNPDFRPPSRESRIFHKMEGTMWVHERQRRLAEIEGTLDEEVKFGAGVLGHLQPGGTFKVVQTEVSPRHWEITRIQVDIKGKAILFKTVNLQQAESMSHFRRLPDDLTLRQAAELLIKEHAATDLPLARRTTKSESTPQ